MSDRSLAASRRSLIAGLGLGAAAMAAPGVRAAEPISLTMVSAWPKGAPGVGVNAQRFADRLAVLSDGRLRLRFFAAGELVPPFEALDAVVQGTADLAHATPYYWVGKSPALHFFTGVPFGLTATEFSAWLAFGGGQALWEEVYESLGVVPFYAGSSGTQAGGWFNREIETPDDFRGLKFRISGLGGEVLRKLGAIPVVTPPGEIAPALASGAVDGADWIGPWNDIAFGLQKFAKYYYMPGFHEPGPSLEVIFNRDRFQTLPADLQAVVRAAVAATAQETLADFTYHNVETYTELATKYGVEVRRFSDDVVRALGEATREVMTELAESDTMTRKVYDSYRAFLANAAAYASHAEQGFLNMRSLAGWAD